jgi:hypothetical protein
MLIQEHEEEMDVLAIGMESLRSKHARTSKLIKLRRGLLFVGAICLDVGVLALIVTGAGELNGGWIAMVPMIWHQME